MTKLGQTNNTPPTPADIALAFFAGLSAISSLITVVSYLTFKELRKLRFLEFIFYVSLNDFIASTALGLFAVWIGPIKCFLQGFFTTFNYVSSAIWTVIITYQLYLVVTRGKIISETMYFHIFGWLLPLVVSLLPLSTDTYGADSSDPSDSSDHSRNTVHWCFIRSTSRSFKYSKVVWEILSFYLWIWLAILFMLYIVVYVNIKVNSMQFVSASLQASVRKLYLYPIIFIVSWILPSICDIYQASTLGKGSLPVGLLLVANYFPAMQGLFLFIVVFWKNPLIRDCWAVRFRMWAGQIRIFYNSRVCSRGGNNADETGDNELGDHNNDNDENNRRRHTMSMSNKIIKHEADHAAYESSQIHDVYQSQIKSINMKIEQEADHITESKGFMDSLRDSFGAISVQMYSSNSSSSSSSSSSANRQVPEQFTDVKLSAMYEMAASARNHTSNSNNSSSSTNNVSKQSANSSHNNNNNRNNNHHNHNLKEETTLSTAWNQYESSGDADDSGGA